MSASPQPVGLSLTAESGVPRLAAVNAAFLIQFAGSLVAVGLLVALTAWAKIARDAPPLDEARARAVLGDEFPDARLDGVWVADDGRSAVARSGGEALLLAQVGDGYVARTAPWGVLERARRSGSGVLTVGLDDVAAPALRLRAQTWPPRLEAAS
jgi:hypothetical protein